MLVVEMDYNDRQHTPTLRSLLVLEQRIELSMVWRSYDNVALVSTKVTPKLFHLTQDFNGVYTLILRC